MIFNPEIMTAEEFCRLILLWYVYDCIRFGVSREECLRRFAA